MAVKKETGEMSSKSSIGPSHPISEKATSHVGEGLNKTSNKGGQKLHVFLIKRVRRQCYIFWLSSG